MGNLCGPSVKFSVTAGDIAEALFQTYEANAAIEAADNNGRISSLRIAAAIIAAAIPLAHAQAPAAAPVAVPEVMPFDIPYGKLIGALGASGGIFTQDEVTAKAGLEALGVK